MARVRRAVITVAKIHRFAGDAGFFFCDLSDIDATISAGLIVLKMRFSAPKKSSQRKLKSVADLEDLRRVLEPMGFFDLSCRAMADALVGVGKLSSTGRPLAPAQIGRRLQRLGLSGDPLGSDQAWFTA